ncbi:TRS130 [Candida pseudojiufengensis]|uniref:TRS130 n=1 Tax=Candida pseudojiufengensis TaxID=497109 RepID=UPI0022257BC3|nr:TRS130 [Candida pseudojiufengensis]KAI5965910.1 TRS130 [Candida pseudojiufengensis]
MSNDSIKIGYYDPFGIYSKIENEIKQQLPLSNLHIKLQPNQPFKTINQLQVQFVEEVPKTGDYISSNDLKTYVRLMFVQIDNVEKYRGQVRPLIREWLKNLVLKTNCSWMIVLYIPHDTKDKASTLIKTSFFDKLQNDFGPDGKVLTTILPTTQKFNEGSDKIFKFKDNNVEEFTVQLKNLLLNSFVGRYNQYNEFINQRKSHNIERFVNKLELCNLFRDMVLLQDALNINEQLFEDLIEVYEHNQEKFLKTQLDTLSPPDVTKYYFEQSINEDEVKSQLLSNENISYTQIQTLLFIHESWILQQQAKLALSNSLASKQISRLYKKLMLYLNERGGHNYEIEYLIVEHYLNLPIIEELVKPNPEDNSYLVDILEMRAELKLYKRSIVSKIARSRNIQINGLTDLFEEISLNDDQPTTTTLELKSKDLVEITSSKSSYIKTFQELTEEIIEDLVKCNRVKTIDILSIDLAIINYEIKNFEECLNTLQNSFEYFIENDWNFLGGILLEIYLGCIENLNDKQNDKEILINCVNLLECLVKNQNSIDINSYQKIKSIKQIQKIFEKIETKSRDIEEQLEFDLNNYFRTNVLPFAFADDSTTKDVYYIEVEIQNPFGVPISISSISLNLIDERNSEIKFYTEEISLSSSHGLQKFKLFTSDITFGLFSCQQLQVALNSKIRFTKLFNQEKLPIPDHSIFDDTVIEYNQISSNSILPNKTSSEFDNILIYQNLNKFRAQFFNVKQLNLGSSEILLELNNSKNLMKSIEIKLFSTTKDLTIFDSLLKFDTIDSDETKQIIIPFKDIHETKLINMGATITYFVDDEKYSSTISYNVDTTLSISVSVQDIFKTKFIYSKFQVGTINSKFPIKLISQNLETEDYEVSSPNSSSNDESIAFGEQPIIFFYKIVPKKNHKINESDRFKLTIKYINLKDESDEIINQVVLGRLQDLNLERYWYLIKEILLTKIKIHLNNFAINDEITVSNLIEFQEFSNKIIERYISELIDQNRIQNLLATVFQNPILKPVEQNYDVVNQLTINVAVPILQYLQVIEYEFDKRTYVVGEPITLKLIIKTLTNWSENSKDQVLGSSSPTRNNNGSIPQLPTTEEFQINIQNDDNWLVSGFKRKSFIYTGIKENENITDLILIPLNVGKLILPKISIKLFDNVTDSFINSNNLDLEFINGSETILVVPDVNNITFSF